MNLRLTTVEMHPRKARYCLKAQPGVLAILVRHAATKLNNPSNPIVRGWEDIELSSEGVREAEETARMLEPYHPQYVYHSDFMRDSETAHIIAHYLNIPTEADFNARTWDVGSYSGEPESVANPPIQRLYRKPWETPPGSTESFNEFSRRFLDFLESKLELAAQVKAMRPVVIVTHGRCIALAQSHIEGTLPWESDMPVPGGIALISVGKDGVLSLEFVGERESVMDDV